MRRHRFDGGQPVSYAEDGAEDGKLDIWKGGYETVRLCDPESANRNMQSGEGAVATANDLHWNERG
jgi:hypothetical protein